MFGNYLWMRPFLEVSDWVAVICLLLQLKTFPPVANFDNSGKRSFHLSPFCLLNFQRIIASEGEQERIWALWAFQAFTQWPIRMPGWARAIWHLHARSEAAGTAPACNTSRHLLRGLAGSWHSHGWWITGGGNQPQLARGGTVWAGHPVQQSSYRSGPSCRQARGRSQRRESCSWCVKSDRSGLMQDHTLNVSQPCDAFARKVFLAVFIGL